MMAISKMVDEATVRRDRVLAAAAIMTVSQTYMAAVADLGSPQNTEALGKVRTSL